MIVGERLRKLRKERGLSQTELGKFVGLGKSAICCYEKEVKSPSIETLIEFTVMFQTTMDYLCGVDNIGKTICEESVSYVPITKEELYLINELKKDKLVYSILFDDPKRGVALIKKKIG